MEELSLFKDYITLDDSYFNFVELVDEEGYSICLKEGIDLKEEIKIFIPSLYKNKPIKKVEGTCFENEKVIGVCLPDSEHKIEIHFGDNFYIKELYVGNNCEFTIFCNLDENRLERIIISKESKIYDSRNNSNAIIELKTDTLLLGCNNTIIPNGVKSISLPGFSGCLKLDRINLPETLIKIESDVFRMSSIKELFIPKNVGFIEYSAFYWCKELEKINVDKDNLYYDSRDNSNAIIESCSNTLIAGCKNTTISNSIKIIGYNAFNNIYPNSELIIPDNVEIIEEGAFLNCKNIKKVFIGKGVRQIELRAFGFLNIEEIEVDKANPYYDSRDNSNAIIDSSSNKLIVGCQNTIIPNAVKSIGRYAFYGCTKLKEIKIPDSVIEIESFAFSYCDLLSSITLPKNIRMNGFGSFERCKSLKSVKIPENTYLNCGTFERSNLESVYDLDNARFFEHNSFYFTVIKLISLNKNLNDYMKRYIYNSFPKLETIIYKNKEYKRKDLTNNSNYWYFENERVVINEIN